MQSAASFYQSVSDPACEFQQDSFAHLRLTSSSGVNTIQRVASGLSVGKKIIFTLILLALTLVVLELGLRLGVAVSPGLRALLFPPNVPARIKDNLLDYRGNPLYPGHDARGFRNDTALDHAAVVALGDSQTYGFHVSARESWPRQFEKLSGLATYNMGFGGYGPTQSYGLFSEALRLHPDVVIEALYVGNDLFDAYDSVYTHHHDSEMRSSDPAVSEAIEEAEKREPLRQRIRKFTGAETEGDGGGSGRETADSTSFRLLRLIHALLRPAGEPWEKVVRKAAQNPQSYEVFDNGDFRTVFRPQIRLAAADIRDPRIEEGLRITLDILGLMKKDAGKSALLVLLIPTKELVFKDVAGANSKKPSADYLAAVANEEEVFARIRRSLVDQNIPYADALPWLRKCFRQGEQPYFAEEDGHPNATGYRAIAQAAWEEFEAKLHH